MFYAVLFFIFAAVLGTALRDTLWCNTLKLFNVIFAGLAASSLGPVLAHTMRTLWGSRAIYFTFLALWFVFWIVCGLLQTATNKLSRVKVKFNPKVNLYGGYVAALLLALTFLSFSIFTMHQAPLAEKFMFKGFNSNGMMTGAWYNFYAYVGGGAMAGSNEAKSFDEYRRGCDEFRRTLEKHVEATGTTASEMTFK